MKQHSEHGSIDRSYVSELGSRIDAVSKRFKTRIEAAEAAGISTDQLARYISGDSPRLGFVPIAKLCKKAGVSLDWLATGKEPEHIDQTSEDEHAYHLKLMLDTIETVEENCIKKNMHMEPKEKALLIKRIYEYLLKYEKNDADKEVINDLINLAS